MPRDLPVSRRGSERPDPLPGFTPPEHWPPPRGAGAARDHDVRPTLHLTLLGPMRARDADGNDVLPRLRKARAVLAILALAAPRPVLRSRLSALLWSLSDPFHALVSLRMAVSELKAALGPEARLLRAGRTDIALGATELRVDARQVVSAGSAPPDSLASWSGAFLPDLVGLDPALDRWLSEQQQGLTRQARGAAEATVAEGLARLSPCDIVLVEGYKAAPIPKLEVWRPSVGKPLLHPGDPHVIALATDDRAAAPPSLPLFDLGDVQAIASFVAEHAVAGPWGAPIVRPPIDERPRGE